MYQVFRENATTVKKQGLFEVAVMELSESIIWQFQFRTSCLRPKTLFEITIVRFCRMKDVMQNWL